METNTLSASLEQGNGSGQEPMAISNEFQISTGESLVFEEWISFQGMPSRASGQVPTSKSVMPESQEGAWANGKAVDDKNQSPIYTLDVLCPLCFSQQVYDPVQLHDAKDLSKGNVCMACRDCAAVWQQFFEMTPSHCAPCPMCDEKVCSSAGSIRSVSCRMDVLSRAPNNPVFGELLEFHSAEKPTNQCGACEEQKAAVVCVQCGFSLCSLCHETTHAKGRFRLHEVLSLDQARHRRSHKCSTHPDRTLDLYCRSSKQCVCVICCFGGDQRSSDVVPLTDVAKETTEKMKQLIVQLDSAGHKADEVQRSILRCMPLYKDRCDVVREQVTSTFASLREALNRREERLLEQWHTSVSGKLAEMNRYVQLSADVAKVLQTSQNRFGQLLDSVDSVSLMNAAITIQRSYDFAHSLLLPHLEAAEGVAQRLDALLAAPNTGKQWLLFSLPPFKGSGGATTSDEALQEYERMLSQLGHLHPLNSLDVRVAPAEEVRLRKAAAEPLLVNAMTGAPPGLLSIHLADDSLKQTGLSSCVRMNIPDVAIDDASCATKARRPVDPVVSLEFSSKSCSAPDTDQLLVKENFGVEDWPIFKLSCNRRHEMPGERHPQAKVLTDFTNTLGSGGVSRKRILALSESGSASATATLQSSLTQMQRVEPERIDRTERKPESTATFVRRSFFPTRSDSPQSQRTRKESPEGKGGECSNEAGSRWELRI